MNHGINALAHFLHEVDVFASLDDDAARRLARFVVRIGLQSGEHAIRRGEQGDMMYVVRDGLVYADVEDRHGRPMRAHMTRGDVFGEMALLTGSPRNADVIAETDSVILGIPKPVVDELIANEASVADHLTRKLGDRLQARHGIKEVGKYRVTGLLGRGGMSVVFAGRQEDLQRPVALKMLAHSLVHVDEFSAWFEREARFIANLRHPNIVEVYDWVEAYATKFIVMEQLDGTDLSDIIWIRGALPPDEVRSIICDVARALAHTHERAIVHRDIKPSNVFVNNNGTVKLTDFGIALSHELPGDVTKFVGTPTYSSPEQATDGKVDGRSDIYSLGIIAFEMLTGKPPFGGDNMLKVLSSHVNHKFPDLRDYEHPIPDDLIAFVEQATQKRPADRFQKCEEITDFLERSDTEHGEIGGVRSRNLQLVYSQDQDQRINAFVEEIERLAAQIPGLRIKS